MEDLISNTARSFLTFLLIILGLQSYADDYFWVGNSGNWSDINHWSTTSGGNILHNTPPSADDDVYFDGNSFFLPYQIVSVNTENAVCRNLDWSGVSNNPTFTNTTSVNIRLFGSLILSPGMQYQYAGTLTFEATTTGNIIKTEGHTLLNNIIFGGIDGEWKLSDSLTIDGNIFLNYGNFLTDNKTINCNNFSSATTNNRTLVLGNSHLFMNGSWTINTSNLNFNSGNSVINIGQNLTNSGDLIVNYNKVVFPQGSNINNSGAYVYYDSILVQLDGNVKGDCYINQIEINGNGSISDNDTIKFLRINGIGSVTGGHIIDTALFDLIGFIDGENYIRYTTIKSRGTITESNQIDYLRVGDTAIIKGQNVFGHLFLNRMAYIRQNNFAQYAYLNCGGNFEGNNTFDTLLFSPGFEYILQYDSILTINRNWSVNGNCEAPIFIKSSYNGKKAFINAVNATVAGSHLSLRDIHAAGNLPFIASQSVDLGNNNNWTIDTMALRNLYWVSGKGNWNDSFHWSLNSGGTGGHCPPTEKDNVFFDGNSAGEGDSIIINTTNAVCHDMDWTGAQNPVFFGPDTNFLKLYGSLKFSPDMEMKFLGETHFEDTLGNKTIFSAEKKFNYNVRFLGNDGDWKLLDEFNCMDTIYQERGSISTDGSNILSSFYLSTDTNLRALFLHQDTVKLSGTLLTWRLNARNFDLHADSSVIVTNANNAKILNWNGERLDFHNVHQIGMGSNIINETYCGFNLVTHEGPASFIEGSCTIDTSIMYGQSSLITGSDTIKTAIYHETGAILFGSNIVEIAYFYRDGVVNGSNRIDTALFYDKGTILFRNQIDTTIIFDDAFIQGKNKIRTATLKDKGWFYGTNEFDDLTLTYAKKYIFEHDSVQVINNNWKASGRCTGSIFLMSDVDSEQAIIEKTNGPVEIEYANIRDIKAAGVTPFIAQNSIDLGNNENWEITMGEPLALFWVGGSGNWSDSLHWAPVSGGSGPYCIPSPIDDVYFDINSFNHPNDTVRIDLENATCRNMNWTGSEGFNPVFSGDTTNNLFIYGSLLFNDSMHLTYKGVTHFESIETGRTIETRGKLFNNNAVFQGRTGGWALIDDFATDGDIYLVYGKLNSNNKHISCANFISADSNHRELLLHESELFIKQGWQLNARNLNFDGDSSIINTGYLLKSFNGDSLIYNNVNLFGDPISVMTLLTNDSVYCFFNNIHFYAPTSGIIQGNCTIDTVIFESPSGTIYHSDSINFAWFKQVGFLVGGEHHVKSAIFDGNGTISGKCTVNSAIFNSSGNIITQNTIDTTIIYGDGVIQGDNVFRSFVNIYGFGYIQSNNLFKSSVSIFNQGTLSGTNTILDNLVIYGNANIFGSNNINDALLLDWGDMGGANIFDTLTFTPGNTYTLVSGQLQTINHRFNIRGNNCFPIILKSSTTGNQAQISVVSDTVSGDFIYMKDIAATGPAIFYAGGHSTDISNNTGWIWENAPGYIFGLGLDHANICPGETLILDTENFNGNPDTQYQWSDGTISPTYEVSQPGIYQVLVIYSDSCQVPGEVIVDLIPAPEIDLGEDLQICEGDSVEFIPSEIYIEYLWSNGVTEPSIPATTSGDYWLEVTGENGCKNRDTIYLEVLAAPVIDLGSNQIIHNEEYLILDAGYPADSYSWSTGDTTQTIYGYGIEGGNEYWVVVAYKGCSSSDTIVIDEYPSCLAELPTAFSPNGDILNDELEIFTSGLQILDFKLFNRYGELVFETTDPSGSQKWDGNFKGQKLDMEVFTYYLKAICLDGFVIEKKGNVTLLR